jgi:hypothetical protein
MERYFYFRNAASAAEEDDDATGSTYYPLSSFRGMCSGTAAVTGAVTDDADAFSMFFTPKAVVAGGGEDQALTNNVDVVVVAITTDNNQKEVMDAIMDKIVTHPHAAPVITVYDKNKGGTAVKLHDDIEGITVLHNANA